jgi:hypothetical protein
MVQVVIRWNPIPKIIMTTSQSIKTAVALSAMVLGPFAASAALTPVSTTSNDGAGNILNQVLFGNPGGDPSNLAANRIDDSADQVYDFAQYAVTTLLIEIAGNKNGNKFGIYKPGSTLSSDKALIFDGSVSPVSAKTITFTGTSVSISGGGPTVDLGGTQFGFYLEGPGGTFYSQPSLNAGADQLVTFVGANTLFPSYDRILAFEDLPLAGSDMDYNDMVVGLTVVVPEPSTYIAGGLALLPLLFGLRARWNKKA